MLMRHGPVALVLCLALAAPAIAGDPSKDQLIFTGASAPGTSTLSFANNAYTFRFVGDEIGTGPLGQLVGVLQDGELHRVTR